MKVVAVTLLVLVLVEMAPEYFFISNLLHTLPYELPRSAIPLGFAQLLEEMNNLDVRYLQNCNANKTNGEVVQAYMWPCFDTCTCKIPKCCGIIPGRNSTFRLDYRAAADLTDGVFYGNLGAVSLANPFNCSIDARDVLYVEPPLQLTVPTPIPRYSQNLCTQPGNQTTCPQVAGEKYTLTVPFSFITTGVATSLMAVGLDNIALKATFVAQVRDENGKVVLCRGLWAILANADLYDSVSTFVGDLQTEDPLTALLSSWLLTGATNQYRPK